ncbi:MAG TPA: dihydropteroate synthase, partial [Actinomycetota bacterium]|nr:dihydropteroate synthase [Actinomycetota bacterium]
MLRTIGRRTFDFDRQVAVAAVVNRTPDSFYDQGATWDLDAALGSAERALAAGADWVDVGGVKAGPGTLVTEAEELDRVLPL